MNDDESKKELVVEHDMHQFIRDNAQEIAVREAGEIARWQRVEAAVDAVVAAARPYIREALPLPRSSFQNASDRSDAFSNVEAWLLRAIAAIRFGKDIADITTAQEQAVRKDLTGKTRRSSRP
jgi:hypothetical protein